jgi:glucose/arabinose dehydrogenase
MDSKKMTTPYLGRFFLIRPVTFAKKIIKHLLLRRFVLVAATICSLFFDGLWSPIVGQPTEILADRIVEVAQPIQILSATSDPEDNRLYIPCHNGKVWIFEDGALVPTPFLDLGPDGLDILDIGESSEQGLNGFVFDPDFEENGFVYVAYNGTDPDGGGQSIEQRLMCFKRDANNPDVIDPSQWFQLIEFDEGPDPETGHNGGAMFFGEDGYLYMSIGDGGSTGTGMHGGGSNGDDHGEFGNGQNLKTLFGKIIRIDVHGLEPYTIPVDNPFVGDTAAFDEIWAYGLRNPWRWSFDRLTGDMYVGDVGEVDWEEVSFEAAGSAGGNNYGWRLMEGTHCYEPVVDCDPDGLTTLPIFEYPHDSGWCAVIGGFVYRGALIPSLYGQYILGDGCGFEAVKFWTLHQEGNEWKSQPLDIVVPNGFVPWAETRFGFGEDNKGELYLCTKFAVYKLQSDPNVLSGEKPEELFVYPNPTRGNFFIDLVYPYSIDKIEMWDTDGRLVWNIEDAGYQKAELTVQGLRPGVYSITVHCNNKKDIRTGKLVILPAH